MCSVSCGTILLTLATNRLARVSAREPAPWQVVHDGEHNALRGSLLNAGGKGLMVHFIQTHLSRLVRRTHYWQTQTWVLLAVVLSIFAGTVWDAVFGRLVPLDPGSIGNWLDGLGVWAPLIFMGLLATAVVISPIPSVPLDIAAGIAFGLVWGTVYTLIGAEIGGVIAFLIARWLGRPRLARRLSPGVMVRVDELSRRSGPRALLLMRLLPVFNFDWVSYAAGLTAISLPVFAIATFVGMIPPVVAIVAVGATLSTSPIISVSIFALLVLAVVIPLIWPWVPRPGRPSRKVSE